MDAVRSVSRVRICQLRSSLGTFTSPSNTMSGSAGAGGSRYAAMPLIFYRAPQWQPGGSVRHRRSLDQPIQRVAAHTLRSVVVVAAGWSEVAPTVPEETCDQEHPEEHPHQPWCAEDDSCDQCTDHNERCEPNHG